MAVGLTPFVALVRAADASRPTSSARGQAFLAGAIGGALQLVSGVTGPILDIFYVRTGMTRQVNVSTKAAAQVHGPSHQGRPISARWSPTRPAATSSNGWSWPLPPCFAVLGTTLSRRFLDRLSDKQFYYWTRRVILALGAVYIAQGVWQMAAQMTTRAYKDQVRALLDRLPDDCSFADMQRAHRRADVAQAGRRQPEAARAPVAGGSEAPPARVAEIGEGQMKDRVSIDLKDGVADVRLIRADKMNALDPAMFEGIIEAGAQLAAMKGLRCVVLSGEGKAFCAGLDMGSFAAMKAARAIGACPACATSPSAPTASPTGRSNAPGSGATLPVPVIAAVHGVAFGGGFQIMLGADMRYATADTRFSVMEIKWGLVPDLAGTQLMRHLAREDVVRELTYTGRVFNGEEAQQLGFVTRVVADPRAAALETAKEIADKSPDAIRAAKRMLNDAVAVDAAAGLMAESVGAAEADRLAQPARGRDVEPAEAAANYKD